MGYERWFRIGGEVDSDWFQTVRQAEFRAQFFFSFVLEFHSMHRNILMSDANGLYISLVEKSLDECRVETLK